MYDYFGLNETFHLTIPPPPHPNVKRKSYKIFLVPITLRMGLQYWD